MRAADIAAAGPGDGITCMGRAAFILVRSGQSRARGSGLDPGSLHPADRLALDHLIVAEPVWSRLASAADAAGLPANTLLHAGPAFTAPAEIVRPILNSACAAAVHEGLAASLDQAERMITAGEITLRPAQDHGVVVPLAAVVSASMPLHRVYDAHRGQAVALAPINGGSGPAMRLGLRSNDVVEHLKWVNDEFAAWLESGIAEGIPLVPLAARSLAEGDDCHGRTLVGAELLVGELLARGAGKPNPRLREFLETSPGIFLNLWMAACKCAMRAAEGVAGSSLVTAAGGNGLTAGIQLSGLPGQWFRVPAEPPWGETGDIPGHRALGAVGDSAVVEALGLGAMAVHLSPPQQEQFRDVLPEDAPARRRMLPLGPHPGFHGLDIRLGLSARSVIEAGAGPLIGLGIIDRLGKKGRIGGGIYDMPTSVFAEAMAAVEQG